MDQKARAHPESGDELLKAIWLGTHVLGCLSSPGESPWSQCCPKHGVTLLGGGREAEGGPLPGISMGCQLCHKGISCVAANSV